MPPAPFLFLLHAVTAGDPSRKLIMLIGLPSHKNLQPSAPLCKAPGLRDYVVPTQNGPRRSQRGGHHTSSSTESLGI